MNPEFSAVALTRKFMVPPVVPNFLSTVRHLCPFRMAVGLERRPPLISSPTFLPVGFSSRCYLLDSVWAQSPLACGVLRDRISFPTPSLFR